MSSDDPPTYALTVRQPWAWAIIYAGKDVENRSWKPRRPIRLLIHAGTTLDPAAVRLLNVKGIRTPKHFAGGQIIGVVDVLSWSTDDPSEWAVPLCWHWKLSNPIPALTNIAVRGRPSLWRPPGNWRDSFPPLSR